MSAFRNLVWATLSDSVGACSLPAGRRQVKSWMGFDDEETSAPSADRVYRAAGAAICASSACATERAPTGFRTNDHPFYAKDFFAHRAWHLPLEKRQRELGSSSG